jgi:hypothetical protein
MNKEALLDVLHTYFAETGIALANPESGRVLDPISQSYLLSDLAEVAAARAPRWDEEVTREIPFVTLDQILEDAEGM